MKDIIALLLCSFSVSCSGPEAELDLSGYVDSLDELEQVVCSCYPDHYTDAAECAKTFDPVFDICELDVLNSSPDGQPFIDCVTASRMRYTSCIDTCPSDDLAQACIDEYGASWGDCGTHFHGLADDLDACHR